MHDYFPDKPPRDDLTPEEKTQIARKFCRRAKLTDVLWSLGILSWLASLWLVPDWNLDVLAVILMLGGVFCSFLTFTRCPCCGRLVQRGEHFGLFVWRSAECPVCGFMPEWSR